MKELAAQGSMHSGCRGLLGSLVSSNRAPPLTPDAFATVLSKKEFTNGADSATVINLYRDTATALLGSTRELRYEKLEWKEAQFERLGEALCYCGALETLEVQGRWRAKRHGGGGCGGGSCVVHVAEDAHLYRLRIPHGAARPVGAHVAADAQPQPDRLQNAPSRRCPTSRRSRR